MMEKSKTLEFESIRFPSDMDKYPFISFEFINFRNRWLLLANDSGSSSVEKSREHKDTIGHIFLPMTQDVQANVTPQWEMQDSKVYAAGAQIWYQNQNAFEPETLVAMLAPTAEIANKFGEQTANPKKQAFFQGIDPREFSFSYTFSPQSEEEAKTLEKIIYQFTRFSLPALDTQTDAFFDFPIEYLIKFNNVKGFPKLSYCICTGVATNYTSSAMQILRSGHTVQIGLTIAFKETTVRTRDNPGLTAP